MLPLELVVAIADQASPRTKAFGSRVTDIIVACNKPRLFQTCTNLQDNFQIAGRPPLERHTYLLSSMLGGGGKFTVRHEMYENT